MSKLSRIRIVNLNYNHDSINIDDKTFDLGGESTLISLRNGGGKSVLVQMVVSLFVNKTYRDFADREFKSYFNTNRPTFLMTEWQLDNSRDRFIAGMMVRKNQKADNEDEALEMFTFTGSYSEGCRYDLDNIPIVKTNGTYKLLRGFTECKNALEEISREREGDFRFYDMESQYSRSQYFNTLRQYQINHKEWESIIRKVNQRESGLADLFNKSKDEKNLVENWFLKPIEDKLNQDKNKIEEFRSLTFKFIEQYRKNQSNIIRKAVIEKYFEDTLQLKADIEEYVSAYEEKNEAIAEMVLYIRSLCETIDKIAEGIAEKEEQLAAINADIRHIVYEQISYSIYTLCDEKQEAVRERCEQEVRITALTRSIADMEDQLMRYDCSRLLDELNSMRAEKAEVDEKINLLYKDSDNSKSEIEAIGHTLYKLYSDEAQKTSEAAERNEQKYHSVVEIREEKLSDKNNKEKQLQELNKSIGKLEHAVFAYDEVEDRINKDFQCGLMRNIIGMYPDGFLDVKSKEMEEETMQEQNKLASLSRIKTELEAEALELSQEEKANIISINEIKYRMQKLQDELARLEGEKQERMRIMKYAGMKEGEIDNKALILDKLEREIKRLEIEKAELIAEKAGVEKQHRQLKEGKTIELPANVREYFEQNGIETVYGMEWLTKNGRSVKENSELVTRNPFIPYSVIMEKDTFERLKSIDEELYTSFPIPVIIRGELERTLENSENHINTYGNIHFFIIFNNRLLDKNELLKVLSELEKRIAGLKKQIADKTADSSTFAEYRITLERQTYSALLYSKTQKDIGDAGHERDKLELRQSALKQEKERNAIRQKETSKSIEESGRRLAFCADRKREFGRLCERYAIYESDKKSLSRQRSEAEELQKKKSELEKHLLELADEAEGLKLLAKQCMDNAVNLQKKAAVYEAYADSLVNEEHMAGEAQAEVLEARYKALTQKISDAMEDLKERQRRLVGHIANKAAELSRKNKRNMPEEEYRNVLLHEEQYDAIENKIHSARTELNDANERNVRYMERISALGTKVELLQNSLQEKTGKDEPAPREIIADTDFEKRIRLKRYDMTVAEKELKTAWDRKNELSAMANGVSEFSDDRIEVTEERLAAIARNIPDIELAEKDSLESYQRDTKRKLRDLSDALAKKRGDITDEIKLISSREQYADDYFAKTFSNLLSQAGIPHQLARQYEINRSAYENQLEKLKVDLESIDKEQKNIEEMFLEYVQRMNENLAMIDKNSTITVRSRSIKMLRIQVPEWESEKEHFKIRLHDFFEAVIKHGTETLEVNGNLGEYLGNAISTRKLYDDVVGIKNIKIKLYKIEAEREVPITWAEVSANSGGEGFLSAFVILTCLLSYMRRDESDMFTSGEEGKVLIMDNPFAQTYSAHLLKPLMEMAKKTNTQLICLSGLGGDSIYNRFDNIYVLKLVDSSIRNGVLRLETNHIKGAAVKKMVLSDFKTEQLSLFEMSGGRA